MSSDSGLSSRTWLLPALLIVLLAAILPAIYLAATADPQRNVKAMPVALVLEQQSASQGPRVANRVADAVETGAGDALAFMRMTPAELRAAMHEDRVAGAVLIPASFDASVASLFPGASSSAQPTVTILTNAGDGGLSSGLVVGRLTPILSRISAGVGSELIEGYAGSTLPSANRALLAKPFDISAAPFEPLPDASGMGTSAFYFSLILVLVAFVGASLVGPLVDASLGVIPSEVGPLVARRPYTPVSRRRTFLLKAAILVAVAPVAALVVQLVAAVFGVGAPHSMHLWLFATAVIAAIGTSALAVFAVFGPGLGSLVNMLFLVALAMVSSGGIVPLEATPPFFHWLSVVAPFRHVIDGVRSLLYFDGNLTAGLGSAWISVILGGAAGLLLGVGVTTLYGRVGRFSRHPVASDATAPPVSTHA
jgi:uncharacterized phage infection (PIP) family protein YhgE